MIARDDTDPFSRESVAFTPVIRRMAWLLMLMRL